MKLPEGTPDQQEVASYTTIEGKFYLPSPTSIKKNTAAEAMVIHDALLLCVDCILQDIVLESNLHVLVDMLRVGACSHWRF